MGRRRPASWEETIKGTVYIYGLEILAIVAIVLSLGESIINKNIMFYIDNRNAMGALVKGYTDSPAVDIPIRMFWTWIQSL